MSDPQHATYSRYIYTRDGRVYGYLFTDSEGNQWGDLLSDRGAISHRHHAGSLHAAAGHHLHHGFAHRHRGHNPHHLQTVAAATDSLPGHRRAIPAPRINPYSGEVIDPNDGMADRPGLQALFHSSAGQPYWGASYRLVRDVTVIYEALAFAPMLVYMAAPYIGPAAEFAFNSFRIGRFGPALNRVFWSGSQAVRELTTNRLIQMMASGYVMAGLRAAEVAEEEGGYSLEMTPFGKLLNDYGVDTSTRLGKALWGYASNMFATGAEGPIFSVQSDVVFTTGFWAQVEYGIVVVKNEITYLSSRGSW